MPQNTLAAPPQAVQQTTPASYATNLLAHQCLCNGGDPTPLNDNDRPAPSNFLRQSRKRQLPEALRVANGNGGASSRKFQRVGSSSLGATRRPDTPIISPTDTPPQRLQVAFWLKQLILSPIFRHLPQTPPTTYSNLLSFSNNNKMSSLLHPNPPNNNIHVLSVTGILYLPPQHRWLGFLTYLHSRRVWRLQPHRRHKCSPYLPKLLCNWLDLVALRRIHRILVCVTAFIVHGV